MPCRRVANLGLVETTVGSFLLDQGLGNYQQLLKVKNAEQLTEEVPTALYVRYATTRPDPWMHLIDTAGGSTGRQAGTSRPETPSNAFVMLSAADIMQKLPALNTLAEED